MPHDLQNQLLKVGDEVSIRCRVTHIGKSEEACNLTCTPLEPAQGSSYSPSIVLNTHQVVRTLEVPRGE